MDVRPNMLLQTMSRPALERRIDRLRRLRMRAQANEEREVTARLERMIEQTAQLKQR